MARRKRFKKNQPFKWKHYSGDIILWLVRWYGRYALRPPSSEVQHYSI
ncbi:hypothetical protein [Piscirickettsia salmonis]|nr:hypothetical protein PsalBI1_04458 [Piscirickettsia salmonis]